MNARVITHNRPRIKKMKQNSTNSSAANHPQPPSVACKTHFSSPGNLVSRQRILVAEDNESVRQILYDTLTSANFYVDAAADGEEAWRALQSVHYDLLVTDNEMPRLTGLELIKRIREAGMRLPVIMASATISETVVRDYADLQIAVVPKPFALRDLRNTVNNALRGSEGAVATTPGSFVQAPALRSTPQARTVRPDHPRVLIVDDDQTVRGSLAAALESEGYAVEEAGGGNEAIHWATNHPIDLVLLDLNMPHGDGWTTFREFDRVTPLLPVVVITARPNQYEEAVRAGVDAFMEKPLDIPVLMCAIKNLTSKGEDRRVSRITNRAFVTQWLGGADSRCTNF
jgi:two-component system, sensor histidine kinase and response regulator